MRGQLNGRGCTFGTKERGEKSEKQERKRPSGREKEGVFFRYRRTKSIVRKTIHSGSGGRVLGEDDPEGERKTEGVAERKVVRQEEGDRRGVRYTCKRAAAMKEGHYVGHRTRIRLC